MSLQQKDDSRYEFQMPKFWDFTNSIPQKRPDESWFCPENVSGPSFPGRYKKKRRQLRVKYPLNKPVESHNQHAKAPVPEKPTTDNVFDRLSTHSTISASKKMHQHPSVEKGRPTPTSKPQKLPSQTTVTQEDGQYQLDEDTPAEPVADRIARIEKELSLSNNAPFKRSNSNDQSSSQPSKIQKIINAQFSSLSSSLSLKHDIPRSRPTKTTTTTNTNIKPTAKHPAQTSHAQDIKAAQPAPQPHPPVVHRRSLYNELQMQKTAQVQQDEKIRSSTPMPSSVMSPSHSPYSKAPRPSLTHRRSLHYELQSQKNGPSHQKEEKPLARPNPPSQPAPLPSAPQSQAPHPPSLIPQPSQPPISPQLPQPSQLPPSQAQAQLPSQPQPPRQDDIFMKEAEEVDNDDDTATSDFFEDLLRARREKANAQAQQHTKAPTNDFFDSLMKSSQEKYKSARPHSPNEENTTDESPATYFGNLLKTSEKRHAIKPLQQQDKENIAASHNNVNTTLTSSQEKHKKHHSLHTGSQTHQENRGEPSRASSIDMKQPRQQADDKRPSVPSYTAITTDQRKESAPKPVSTKAVPPPHPSPPPLRSTQMYTTSSKQKYTLQEDRYFTDQRIAKARKALKESKERTRKWLEALSPNQPMKH